MGRRAHLGAAAGLAAALALCGGTAAMADIGDAQAAAPAKASISSVKAGVGSVAVKVRKCRGARGYQYQVARDSAFKKSAKKAKTSKRSYRFKGLSQGAKWYTRVRGYSGSKYGKWSAFRSVKTKKAASGQRALKSWEKEEVAEFQKRLDRLSKDIDAERAYQDDIESVKEDWGDLNKAEKAAVKGYDAVMAKAPKPWTRSTKGWDLKYPYELKLVNKVRAGDNAQFYLKTDAPMDYMKNIRLYTASAEEPDKPYCEFRTDGQDVTVSSYYSDLHDLPVVNVREKAYSDSAQIFDTVSWVKVKDGYVTSVDGGANTKKKSTGYVYLAEVPSGTQLESLKSYYRCPSHKLVGSYDTYPDELNDGEYDKMVDEIVSRAIVDKSASKGDQMQQCADWILAHSVYPRCYGNFELGSDGFYYITDRGISMRFFSDRYNCNPDSFAAGEKIEIDSLETPMLLMRIGKKIGYPVTGTFPDDAPMPPGWESYGKTAGGHDFHWLAYSVQDRRWFDACPRLTKDRIWDRLEDVPSFAPDSTVYDSFICSGGTSS